MAKACASQGSRNTGPSASRGTPGTATAARMAACGSIAMSGRLQVRLPGVDGNPRGGVAFITPEFVPVESHGVKPLRILAGSRRIAVRENVTADDAFDRTDVTAHVARQARVSQRIDVLCTHFVAGFERRSRICVSLGRSAAMQSLGNVTRRQYAFDRFCRMQ